MNPFKTQTVVVLWFVFSSLSFAQPPRGGEGGMGMMPRGFGPPVFALQEVLDTNQDGNLSSDEIKAAPASLKKLDKDGDGKLSAEEIGWPPRRPDGMQGGRGRPGGMQGGPGGPGGPDGMQGGPGGMQGGPGGPFGGEAAGRSFAERLMNRDADGDGQVTAKELPKSMRLLIPLCDTNKDNAINRDEAEQFEQRLDQSVERSANRKNSRSETP